MKEILDLKISKKNNWRNSKFLIINKVEYSFYGSLLVVVVKDFSNCMTENIRLNDFFLLFFLFIFGYIKFVLLAYMLI